MLTRVISEPGGSQMQLKDKTNHIPALEAMEAQLQTVVDHVTR